PTPVRGAAGHPGLADHVLEAEVVQAHRQAAAAHHLRRGPQHPLGGLGVAQAPSPPRTRRPRPVCRSVVVSHGPAPPLRHDILCLKSCWRRTTMAPRRPAKTTDLLYRLKRWMYPAGRPNAVARALNAVATVLHGTGLLTPPEWVTLEVVGRRSGRVVSAPLVVAEHDGERYLVAMLGEST